MTEMIEVHQEKPLQICIDTNNQSTAIRVATKWFVDHLKANSSGENIDVIMLSDDRGNREKAKTTGIKSCGGKELQKEGCFDD